MNETETNTLAGQWKERLAACAVLKAEEQAAEPTAEIELKGFKFIGRRLSLREWIRAGRLPAGILRQILVNRPNEAEADTTSLSADEMVASIAFQRDAIVYAVVEPRIITHSGSIAEDEIRYAEMCQVSPELVDAILQWIFAGCPGVPVPTKEGGVSVETLTRFQQKQPGGTPLRVSTDESEIRDEAESGAGDQR